MTQPWQTMKNIGSRSGIALVLSALVGCSSGGSGSANEGCVPGRQLECTCTDGAPGSQLCNEDREYDACVCEPAAAGSNGGGGGHTSTDRGGTSGDGDAGSAGTGPADPSGAGGASSSAGGRAAGGASSGGTEGAAFGGTRTTGAGSGGIEVMAAGAGGSGSAAAGGGGADSGGTGNGAAGAGGADSGGAGAGGADSGGAGGGAAGAGGSSDSEPTVCSDSLEHVDGDANVFVALTDSMNYRFESSLSVTTTKVRASSDVTFDWSGLTADMLGHPIEPLASIDMMEILLWNVPRAEFLQGINDDSLSTADLVAAGSLQTDHAITSGQFVSIEPPGGTPVPAERLLAYLDPDQYPPSENTYAVMVASGEVFGQGTKMLAFFEPDANETNTAVMLTNTSATVSYTADLSSLTPIGIPAGTGNVVLSWEDSGFLTTNAMGREWVSTKITDVVLGHYEGLTVGDLENEFVDLELLATQMWSCRVTAGQSVELSQLTDEEGASFTGIDDTSGVWLVALKCGTSWSPAPWFLSVLAPCN